MDKYTIYVPKKLIESAEWAGFRKDRLEVTYLFWWLIDSWSSTSEERETGRRWKQIHDSNFEAITRSRDTRAKTRSWLNKSGFIEIRQTSCKDGRLRPRRIRGKESQGYATLMHDDLVPYKPSSRALVEIFSVETGEDLECRITRENIGLLKRKKDLEWDLREIGEEKHRNRDQKSILLLEQNMGKVGRGQKVNRLYSPWTSARKPIRELFTLDGDEIASFDLRAAQPTIMATLAYDKEMLSDCKSDVFYTGLADYIGATRKDAKQAFYAYSFGPIRKDAAEHSVAYQTQQWMREQYPMTGRYVDSCKKGNYRSFSREMQNREAFIFVDCIFRQLADEGIPALTVHDSIYFKVRDLSRAKEIAEEHLDRQLGRGLYTLDRTLTEIQPAHPTICVPL
jgi:S-ribosylhomocysteine lyase LuxS involved in autoinducer biosynthesis